jgi:hypothetical protein
MATTLVARSTPSPAVHVLDAVRIAIVAAVLGAGGMPAAARAGSEDIVLQDQAAPAESGDRLLAGIVAQYGRAELDRGAWINPYVPSAAAANPITAVEVADGATVVAPRDDAGSGDEMLMRAVAEYTRAALDRGGWENQFVTDPSYAAGNPLLAVPAGEGVTTVASEARATSVSQR